MLWIYNIYKIQLIYTAFFINTCMPSYMNKSEESILELFPSMPVDVSGVSL